MFERTRSDRQQQPTRDDWLRIGRLEAAVENLTLQWASYRDELKRLVERLEKRDQRAAQRAAAEAAAPDQAAAAPVDEVTARVNARRKAGGHGLPAVNGPA